MINSVEARYLNGAIVPMETLDIEERAALVISIEVKAQALATERGLKALRATAGGWKRTHDPDELISNIYESRLGCVDISFQPYESADKV